MKRKDTFARLMSYAGRHPVAIAVSFLSAILIVGLTLYIPVLAGDAVDLCIGKGQVDFGAIMPILVRIGISTLLIAVAQYAMNLANNKLCFETARDLRRDAFGKLGVLPVAEIDSHSHGDILNRVISDVDQVSDGLLMGASQLFTGLLTILGTLAFMLSINLPVAAVVIVITPVSLLVAGFIARRTYDMFKLSNGERGRQAAFVNEVIQNQKLVKAYGREQAMETRFDGQNDKLEGYTRRAVFFSSITNPSTRFVNSLVYAGVGVAGALAAINGNLSVGQLTCFLSYANQYTKPFNEISGVITELQNALSCAARVFELLDTPQITPDAVGATELTDPDGKCEMKDVAFSYVPEKPFIEHMSFSALPGTRTAIVGPTGCGKTTLINLIMRFYEPSDGGILLSGQDIRSITRHSLRNCWGMVLQDTWLRSGSVRDNIAMGCPGATEEEIVAAAKACHAHSFITRLENGYDTVIGEDGGTLSQGQKQLLCISRVMLRQPRMLILDEATSSIDTRTEVYVQRAFQELMKGRTSIIVAHRLSTIMNADNILVMRDGKIMETGTHEELIRKKGEYYEIYNSQFR